MSSLTPLTPTPPAPQSRAYLGMSTLRELIFKRPSRQFQYLHVLLDLCSHEKEKVTGTAGDSGG